MFEATRGALCSTGATATAHATREPARKNHKTGDRVPKTKHVKNSSARIMAVVAHLCRCVSLLLGLILVLVPW